MVMNECSACPRCGGRLKYYDSVPRLVRTKGRQTSRVPMRRLRCSGCGAIHRELGGGGPCLWKRRVLGEGWNYLRLAAHRQGDPERQSGGQH